MNAKRLSKFSISKKLTLLGAIIAIAIIAAFSICAINQANAETESNAESFGEGTLSGCDRGGIVKHIFPEAPDKSFTRSTINIIDYLESREGALESNKCVIQCSYINGNPALHVVFGTFIIKEEIMITLNSTESKDGYYQGIPYEGPITINNSNYNDSFTISYGEFSDGLNVSGHVADVDNPGQVVPGAFVQYCHGTPWGSVPVEGINTFTDWFGNYTIEGVTEDMLPGVIRVYRFGYEVGESWPIWGAPEGEDTVYRFIEMTPAEPPVPPVPPTPPTPPEPPTPPVPPQPVPPQPVPPVPTPTPTPVDPGTNIPQTGDTASSACAMFVLMVLLSAGVLAGRKFYVK